ncbi:MAG: thioredoxin family protein [Hyphomicrobiales bacterium]
MGKGRKFGDTIVISLLVLVLAGAVALADELGDIPPKGKLSLVVLGTPTCPPCIRMKPILEKIGRQYAEKATVIPVDISIHPEQAARFGVKAIPVEVFFDADGREIYRHLGFMSEKDILDQFKKMGLD